MDPDSGHSWSLDQSRVETIESIASSLGAHSRSLSPRWTNLGLYLIDTAMLTSALAFLTLLTVGVSYLTISRRHKDSYLTLAIWVIPEWVTAATRWLTALSQVAQQYAMLGSYLPGIHTGITAVSSCISGKECILGDDIRQTTPVYTFHGCFGTVLLSSNVLVQEGVLCALVLCCVLPEFGSGKVMKAVVVAPFLAACISASLNSKNVCIPPDIVLGGLVLRQVWVVFEPLRIDTTTAMFARLSHMVTLLVLGMWIWRYRYGFIAQLSGTTEYGYQWVKPLLVMYGIPPAVGAGMRYLQNTFPGGMPRNGPLWAYVLFSAAYSFVPQLMGMWPGLVMIFQRLRMPDSILPTTQAKGDVAALPNVPNSQAPTAAVTDVKVDLSSFSKGAVTLSDDSHLDEK